MPKPPIDLRPAAIALLLLFAVSSGMEVARYALQPPGGLSDFFGLWSWSHFVALQGGAKLYDPAAMHEFQRAIDPAYAELYYPFLYPPNYLLLIWPLGHLAPLAARIVWTVVSLSVFLLGVFGLRWRRILALAALAAPSTGLTLICGQNGLITAGLLAGGLRLAGSRPGLAGCLLGLLSIKPQLALLTPVALIAAGRWRVLLTAAVTAGALAGLSSLAFGAALWPEWWAARAAHWRTIQEFIAGHDRLIPTVSAFMHALAFGTGATAVAQIAAGLAASVLVWRLWRRDPDSPHAIAAVPAATLLATPYAFLYDLPILTSAVLVLLGDVLAGAATLGVADAAVLAAALALPQLMFSLQDQAVPLATPVLLLFLLQTARWRTLAATSGIAIVAACRPATRWKTTPPYRS